MSTALRRPQRSKYTHMISLLTLHTNCVNNISRSLSLTHKLTHSPLGRVTAHFLPVIASLCHLGQHTQSVQLHQRPGPAQPTDIVIIIIIIIVNVIDVVVDGVINVVVYVDVTPIAVVNHSRR